MPFCGGVDAYNEPILRVEIAKGYRLLLLKTPWEVQISKASLKIHLMLQKNAVSEISPHTLGFYSNIFLVRKASGGWRPVIDSKQLNSQPHGRSSLSYAHHKFSAEYH